MTDHKTEIAYLTLDGSYPSTILKVKGPEAVIDVAIATSFTEGEEIENCIKSLKQYDDLDVTHLSTGSDRPQRGSLI